MSEIITSDRIETEDPKEPLNIFVVVAINKDMGEYLKAVCGVFATEAEASTFIGLTAMDIEEEQREFIYFKIIKREV